LPKPVPRYGNWNKPEITLPQDYLDAGVKPGDTVAVVVEGGQALVLEPDWGSEYEDFIYMEVILGWMDRLPGQRGHWASSVIKQVITYAS